MTSRRYYPKCRCGKVLRDGACTAEVPCPPHANARNRHRPVGRKPDTSCAGDLSRALRGFGTARSLWGR